jgi:hypothetical protein
VRVQFSLTTEYEHECPFCWINKRILAPLFRFVGCITISRPTCDKVGNHSDAAGEPRLIESESP